MAFSERRDLSGGRIVRRSLDSCVTPRGAASAGKPSYQAASILTTLGKKKDIRYIGEISRPKKRSSGPLRSGDLRSLIGRPAAFATFGTEALHCTPDPIGFT